ncbi:FtsX-like permease family protein [Geomonas sp. Red69]|uniref:FtsX-like permease family protein n=1 Tax=Geomonas diazotrophica TaxID=2843197 RepID=A0ABX8JP52_9BACT|nr:MULTISPECIES: FtsX-like permease family protein [Geomonas]MBU5636797.1 FtsX-like permease family protein [Geomonas diazotrophica]QWV98394.1 FtsX-like permease family protein [Geomonas nitrogeniifigens]QXE87576.1 FtsX-like permease family protein [Geomonas nitrogeniifigens]
MFILKYILRNLFRHRLRSILTVVGVAVAVLAFGLLRTLVGLWYSGAEHASDTRLVTRNAISLVFPLPISYLERIRGVSGVTTVSYGSWFGAYYKEPKNFFANYAIEPKGYMELYPEFILSPKEKNDFLLDRKGCIVGERLARTYGWKVGDLITLKGTIYPGQWEFVLRGIYHGKEKATEERILLFHWNYLNETMRQTVPRRADQVGYFIVGVKKPELAPDVALAIDSLFKNSLAETLTETEKAFHMSFVSMTEAIMIAIQIVSYMVIAIIMVVAANTMAMTARERIGEYATLKTLGFKGGHLAGLIFGESVAISFLGGVLGVVATFPAASWIETELAQFFPYFSVSSETLLLELLAALSVGVVSGIFPTWRGATIRIADGLKRIG